MIYKNTDCWKPISYFLAKVIIMGFWGVILKPWRACMAMDDCTSSSKSTNAIPGFASIKRTSLKPGYCSKSISSILPVVSWGKFSMNKILLGAAVSWAPGPWRNDACRYRTFYVSAINIRIDKCIKHYHPLTYSWTETKNFDYNHCHLCASFIQAYENMIYEQWSEDPIFLEGNRRNQTL